MLEQDCPSKPRTTSLDGCSDSIVDPSRETVIGAVVVLLTVVSTASATIDFVVVVTDVKAKASRVDVAVAPEEESTEDWLGENVEDTVEHSLRIGGDDVSTLRQSPGDRVEEPEEHGPYTANEIGPRDITAKRRSVLAGSPGDGPCDKQDRYHSENEVSPLVRRGNQSTNQTSDDHNLVDQDGV